MVRSRSIIVILLLTLSPAPSRAEFGRGPTPESQLADLDSFITKAIKDWKVPGLAIAVVQDGEVIHSKGYGFRNFKNRLPVTPKTLFAIASVTKSFTVSSLGILVDQGRLDWDEPVRKFVPSFRLYDPVASEQMTPRDLVTHRSGLPRHDLVWYNSTLSGEELFERLPYLEPSKAFRSTYQYNNLMFMAAGHLVAQVSGTTWQDFVRQRILLPLGMQQTTFSVFDSQRSSDFAIAYAEVDEEFKEFSFPYDQSGSAGSINSNLEDMTQYLIFHLNKGKYGQQQILSEESIRQMHTPQMAIPGVPLWSELGHSSYGMGWIISTYRGHRLVHHSGGGSFNALATFLPQQNIGMVILVNRGGTPVMDVVSYAVYDRLLGLDQVPWNDRFQRDQERGETPSEEERNYTIRREGTQPSHSLEEYAGEYEHLGYGIVKIDLENDKLKLTYNRITSSLQHLHYDVFEVPEDPLNRLQKLKVNFATNLVGEIGNISIGMEPATQDIVFTRKPRELERSILESLVGQYQRNSVGAATVVSLKTGKTLLARNLPGSRSGTALVPDDSQRELVPVRGLLFSIRGRRGFWIEFKKDASGSITEAVYFQPSGTSVMRRN